MITLRSPLILRPQPTIVAPALPMTVLLDRTRSMPEQEMVPETRMTAAELEPSAVVSAEALVTVVVPALPPPVVPPFWVAQPTRSATPARVLGGAPAAPFPAADAEPVRVRPAVTRASAV